MYKTMCSKKISLLLSPHYEPPIWPQWRMKPFLWDVYEQETPGEIAHRYHLVGTVFPYLSPSMSYTASSKKQGQDGARFPHSGEALIILLSLSHSPSAPAAARSRPTCLATSVVDVITRDWKCLMKKKSTKWKGSQWKGKNIYKSYVW